MRAITARRSKHPQRYWRGWTAEVHEAVAKGFALLEVAVHETRWRLDPYGACKASWFLGCLRRDCKGPRCRTRQGEQGSRARRRQSERQEVEAHRANQEPLAAATFACVASSRIFFAIATAFAVLHLGNVRPPERCLPSKGGRERRGTNG